MSFIPAGNQSAGGEILVRAWRAGTSGTQWQFRGLLQQRFQILLSRLKFLSGDRFLSNEAKGNV